MTSKIAISLICLAPVALAQERKLSCTDDNHSDGARYCEMREVTVPAGGRLDVDGGNNGGVSVTGWDQGQILVRSRVEASADYDAEAKQMVQQVRVEASGGQIRSYGPETSGHGYWGVSFEIFVPRRADLSLKAHNGGVHISGVHGDIQFETVNGGVSLKELAGRVEGRTTNGGVHLELAGSHWEGDKCDVTTTNGGVTIKVPSNYSAHLETGTVNGGLRFDFPVTMQGEIGKRVAVDLGSGGSLVRVMTTNGGINVKEAGS